MASPMSETVHCKAHPRHVDADCGGTAPASACGGVGGGVGIPWGSSAWGGASAGSTEGSSSIATVGGPLQVARRRSRPADPGSSSGDNGRASVSLGRRLFCCFGGGGGSAVAALTAHMVWDSGELRRTRGRSGDTTGRRGGGTDGRRAGASGSGAADGCCRCAAAAAAAASSADSSTTVPSEGVGRLLRRRGGDLAPAGDGSESWLTVRRTPPLAMAARDGVGAASPLSGREGVSIGPFTPRCDSCSSHDCTNA
mmetsp:Transcript_22954/g.59904  ORF Transcript_22954/g.59904 Transcript_22954/m.59904 type:complete len:254 (+) Transcript_22954:549-1310(+)